MDNKTLIDSLSKRCGRSKADVTTLINGLAETIRDKCSDMDIVAVPGFGSFEPKKRLERVSIHPQTGKRLLVPPKIVVAFKPSALLKQKMNPKPTQHKEEVER